MHVNEFEIDLNEFDRSKRVVVNNFSQRNLDLRSISCRSIQIRFVAFKKVFTLV